MISGWREAGKNGLKSAGKVLKYIFKRFFTKTPHRGQLTRPLTTFLKGNLKNETH
jgi:hypothetical protein